MTTHKKPDAGGLPAAEAVTLAELASYQPDAIVSRTLTKRPGGTVTFFAFDEGQSLSEHTAPFDALVQILDGEAELVIDGEQVTAATGQMVLMPANIPHAVNARARFKMLLVMIRDAAS